MATQSEAPDISTLTSSPVIAKIGKLDIVGVQDQEPYLNMLIYGLPGAGKTVLAGSAQVVADMSPVLLIDVEGGTFSLRATHPDVHVVRVKSFAEIQQVYNELYKGNLKYQTVILDSLTEIQRLSMLGIMREVIAKEPERDPEVPSVREWGKNGEQTRRLVRAFRDLPMNCIFTALSIEEKDQKSGKMKHRPSLSGKMATEVPGYVDVCGYLYTQVRGDDGLCRFMLTGTTDTHVAKDRSGRLPLVVEAPSMASIHQHIFG